MDIEWIGTGAGLNVALGNTAFLVKGGLSDGKRRTLLVDCGFTVPPELLRSGQLEEVTDIVLTHNHADHIGGLESLGFMNYFVYMKRPNLYVGSDAFARALWDYSLKGGMQKLQDNENRPFDGTLDTFFNVHTGRHVTIPGMPIATLFPTQHVQGMEAYGVSFANGVWYSGDSIELPDKNADVIFQDCQFYETKTDVHISYDKLKRELPPDVRAKVHLVHLGGGWDKKDPKADGFAGFVKPRDTFHF